MSSRRAIAYVGSALLLLAWLATASGDVRRPQAVRAPSQPGDSAVLQTVVADVQAQAVRLRHRLATAPAPSPTRNPFAFEMRARPAARRATVVAPAIDPEPAAPSEPLLALVGIAEQNTATGLVRTAMISTAGDDLLMVTEGQTIVARYRVTTIGTDVVELKDLATGLARRLALQ